MDWRVSVEAGVWQVWEVELSGAEAGTEVAGEGDDLQPDRQQVEQEPGELRARGGAAESQHPQHWFPPQLRH